MNLKTYQAPSMPQALALVKRDLGKDAVILHTRTFKKGGFMGFGGKSIVEITASNNVNVIARNKPKPKSRKASPKPTATQQSPNNQTSNQSDAPNPSPLLNKLYNNHTAPASEQSTSTPQPKTQTHPQPTAQPQPQQESVPPIPSPVQVELQPATGSTPSDVVDELQEIRRMVHRMMAKQSQSTPPDLPQELFDQYLALLEQEVAEELAEDVIAAVREQLPKKKLSDPETIKKTLHHEVARMIPTHAESMNISAQDGRPLTLALIGPTGVGKTTTIAKLAAVFKLKQNKKVGLITIDTYRIAAVDQLQTYANIINLDLHVVLTPQEMSNALKKCEDCDVVLIDTAGRSQRDDSRIHELGEFLEIADPHEIHLVLSSTCAQPVLMEAIEKFSHLSIDHIIFTKLDEAVSFGVILNVLRRVNKQISYITTGQEVPHQIEPGQSDRLAELIMGSGGLI